MPGDARYHTAAWRRLRAARLRLDKYTCTVPGCSERATHVDHIVSPRNGGADSLANTRSLCASHDAQVKEDTAGKRRSGGKMTVRGCDAQGDPLDPGSAWWRGGIEQ